MSITSRLFQKAVKVLRSGRPNTREMSEVVAPVPPPHFFEPLESRLLLSTVTIEALGDAAEGGADGTVRITRDVTVGDLTVKFALKGTAKLNRDFTLTDGINDLRSSVVIPDGVAFVDVTIVAIDDLLAEPTEDIIFNLKKGSGYDLSPDFTTRTATVEIDDNEPVVTIVATDAEASEDGDTGTFTITRTGNTTGDLVVNFKRSGNAKFGKDYGLTVNGIALTSQSVVIPDGDASVEIVVVPINDSFYEPTEVVSLTLKNSKAFTLGGAASASVIILDNEPLIFIDPASSVPGSFTITTADGIGADSYIENLGEADEPHDNLPMEVRNSEGIVGRPSKKAYISPDLDAIPFDVFSNAIFTLTLIETEGVSAPNSNWRFLVYGLRDDFTPPAGVQGNDWNEGITYIDAPGNAPGGGEVDLAAMFGGAPLGSFDILGAGTIGATFSITGPLLTDYLNQETNLGGDRFVTFIVVRENVGNEAETIIHKFASRDDGSDPSEFPRLTVFGEVVGASVTEGQDTTIRVFRAGSLTGDVTVDFSVKGTAKLGVDYRLLVGGVQVTNSFVIPDGEDFVDITVEALTDGIYEIDETFTITIKKDNAYTLNSNTSTTVTISDGGPVVSIVAFDAIADEPSETIAAHNTGTFVISRTGDNSEDLVVKIKLSGQAKDGKDYAKIGNTVIIPAGEDFVTVQISPFADDIPEGTEDVIMSIVPSKEYGVEFIMTGTRRTTGSAIRPTLITAASVKDARKLALQRGVGAPVISRELQSDTVLIRNGVIGPGPDLVGVQFNLAGHVNVSNDLFTGSFGSAVIRNQGRSATGAFNVRFRLSADRTPGGADDLILGTQTIAGLNAGQSISVAIVFNDAQSLEARGLDAGRYFIIMEIDVDDFVVESFEGNNTLISILNEVVIVD